MIRFKCLLMIALFCSVPQPLRSQEATPETAEDLAFLEEACRAGYGGHYREAARDLRDYLEDFPGSIQAREGLIMMECLRGRYEDALEVAEEWLEVAPGHADALCRQAGVLERLGRYKAAEEKLREALLASPGDLKTRCLLAENIFASGRRDEARELARSALEDTEFNALDGTDLCFASRLYLLLGDLDRAAQTAVYADYHFNGRRGSGYRYERHEALLLLGELYRMTRLGSGSGDRGSGNRALSCFQDALKVNPNHPDALLGLARTRAYAFKFHTAHTHLDRALAINPVHGEVLAFKAHLLTMTRQYERALDLLDRGLAVNPHHKALLAQMAAVQYFLCDEEGYEQTMAEALITDRTFGEAYSHLGDLLIYHYRFDEAERVLRKSIELDPDFNEAYILLARTLANLGREEEARQALLTSQERDPYDYPWRNNMLKVLADLDTYQEVDSDLFRIFLDVEETGVMCSYLLDLGRRSFDILEDRYGFTASGPILMEMFPSHQDFAVRTVGFTGLGALGACFGRVVTLLSPRAQPFRGTFNWASTLHHELAHVFTLQMSGNRIPRWFTEGISVFEEGECKEAWRRNLDMELFNSYHNDDLFKLEEFDSGFMGPRVLFAYYQAGLTVRFMVERFGMEKVQEMIRAYGKGLTTERVVELGCGFARLEDFDAAFREWLWASMVRHVRCQPFYDADMHQVLTDAAKEDPKDPERLLKAAWACHRNDKGIDALFYLNKAMEIQPDHGLAKLLQGELAFARKDKEKAERLYREALDAGVEDLFAYRNLALLAKENNDLDLALDYLIKGKACFPSYIGPQAPRTLLVSLYRQRGEEDQAVAEMEELFRQGGGDLLLALKLGQHYVESEAPEKAVVFLEEAVQIDPFHRMFHFILAREHRKMGSYTDALKELDVAMEVQENRESLQELAFSFLKIPKDENTQLADVHAEKGLILMELGREEAAAEEVRKALLLKADHAQAKALEKKLNP